jgi:transposase
MDPFWLTDEQFAKVAPHLPRTRGKERVDDRPVVHTPFAAPRTKRF